MKGTRNQFPKTPLSLNKAAFTLLFLFILYLGYHFSQNSFSVTFKKESLESCVSEVWCSTTIPRRSFFRFKTPITDLQRWRIAQNQAARGEPVLLRKILTHFPNPWNFIDGDVNFRSTHALADYFIDSEHGFDFLYENNSHVPEKYKYQEIPPVYHAQRYHRAPIIMAGYQLFDRPEDSTAYFQGKKGNKEVVVGRPLLLNDYQKHREKIHHPFILMHTANENWGLLSMLYPNRTIDWAPCCKPNEFSRIYQLLNDDKLLLLLVNQHHNFTHPKLLSLPRGLPIYYENTKRMIWDFMRSMPQKKSFFFTASSNWRFRPQIKQCIAKKFENKVTEDEKFQFVSYGPSGKGRLNSNEYYEQLIAARLCIALPGLGYDTFRLWESLTLGVVPVLEKGIGLDKTLWRLPALLVEDYDEITPELLRNAYVEALYRVDEFEFERLTQKFWWDLIMNVSTTKSTKTFLDKFPPYSEDPTFTRPAVPFKCTNGCGPRTKRTPKSSC